jgi:RNA polymerase sigma-70 factor (ECF subfamily)
MKSTSASLLERLREPNSEQAWRRFVALLTPLLLLWVRRLGLRKRDAANLVHDVLTQAYQKLPEFTSCQDSTPSTGQTQTFRGWLQHVLRDELRATESTPTPVGSPTPDTAGSEDEPFMTAAEFRRYLVGRTLELIEGDFEPTTWRAFQAYAFGGKDADQAAAELGITAGAVLAAKFRVLSRVRRELSGMLD